jgi:hypothetical protein
VFVIVVWLRLEAPDQIDFYLEKSYKS